MEIWEFNKRKIKICKALLENIINGENYYAGAIVRNGRILKDSKTGSARINLDKTVRDAERCLNSNGKGGACYYSLTVTLAQRKIFFQRLNDPHDENQYWLLVTMDTRRLYFKREFNNVIKKIKIILQ